jgi:hypothetical protein
VNHDFLDHTSERSSMRLPKLRLQSLSCLKKDYHFIDTYIKFQRFDDRSARPRNDVYCRCIYSNASTVPVCVV